MNASLEQPADRATIGGEAKALDGLRRLAFVRTRARQRRMSLRGAVKDRPPRGSGAIASIR
jgi:hypothetical protein